MQTIELKPFTTRAEDGEEAVIYYGEMVLENLMLFLTKYAVSDELSNSDLESAKRNAVLKLKMYMLNANIVGDYEAHNGLHESSFALPDDFTNTEQCIAKCKKFLSKFGVENALINSQKIVTHNYNINFFSNLNSGDEYVKLHTGTTHLNDISLLGIDFDHRKITNIENEPVVYREENYDIGTSFLDVILWDENGNVALLIKPEIIYDKTL